jgi:signal transduction histidine kinase/FixJ family two-component response regulator
MNIEPSLGSKPIVLVVDDDRLVSSAVRQSLEREGFAVELATNIDEALMICQRVNVDVVLTDLIMPGGSGLDLLHRVECIDPFIPVIIVTADENVAPAAEAVRKRAFNYLTKPVGRNSLTAAVQSAVAARRRSQLRREQQEQLRRDHRRLEIQNKRRSMILSVLYDRAVEGIVIWDEHGTLIDASGSFAGMVERESAELYTCDIDEFFEPHPCDGSVRERIALLASSSGQETQWQGEVTIRRRVGRSIPARLSLSLCDTSGALSSRWDADDPLLAEAATRYIVGLVHVDRGHEDLSVQLQQADRLANTAILAGNAAHEIKNDLGPLLGYLSMLEPLDQEGMVASMRESVRRIKAQVEQILAPLRARTRKAGPVFLKGVVDTTLEDLRRAGTLRRIKLSVESKSDGDVVVHADKDDVHQIAMNLVMNACDSLGDGEGGQRGEIRLVCHNEDGFGILDVFDTGSGIPPENLPRIFERFFTTKRTDGTGLGLPVVQDIVRRLGGNVSLTSRPGVGTHVCVKFPLYVAGERVESTLVG